MLLGAFAELVTLGAVIPFIALLAEPSRALDFPWLQDCFTTLGWQNPDEIVLPMTLVFLAIVLLAAGIRLVLVYVSTRFVFGIGYDIGVNVYGRILQQPYSYHVNCNTSEVIAGIIKVQMVVARVLMPLMQGMISLFIATAIIGALLMIAPVIAISSGLGFGLVYVLISVATKKRLSVNSEIISRTNTTRIQSVQEGLGGIRDVILDRSQSHFLEDFSIKDERLRNAQAENQFIGLVPRYLIEGLGIVLIVTLAFVLSRRTEGLADSLPVLGALALGAQRMLPLMQQIFSAWSKIIGNRSVLEDVLEFLSLPLPSKQKISTGKDSGIVFDRSICLQSISFSYPGSDSPVLQGICLEIPKGASVGFIGKTGCGKTTLLDLMMGLLSPSSGRITIDDTLLEQTNHEDWYRMIAHVPQSIFLSDSSISENIAFGVPKNEIDTQRLNVAVKAALLDEFISSLPDGLNTMVGERGVRLSGGQRQRIGIARALYKNAQVLILDEATSALDNATERELMKNLEDLGRDLTVLIIAHRLETLKNCDFEIELLNGQISRTNSNVSKA